MRKNKRFVQYPATIVFWLFEHRGWYIEAGMNICDDKSNPDKPFFINGIHDEYTYYESFENLVRAVSELSGVNSNSLLNNLAFTRVEILKYSIDKFYYNGAR